MRAVWQIVAAVLVFAACSQSPQSGVEAPAGRGWSVAPIVENTHNAIAERLPRVSYQGGPFLRRPRIVTVTFTGDNPIRVDRLVAFDQMITHGEWWHQAVEAYCTGRQDCIEDGDPASHIHIDTPLPAQVRDVDIEQLLVGLAGAGRFDPAQPDLLLMVYPPAGVQLSDAASGRYCDGPRGYHRSARINDVSVAYAVVPHCGELDQTTTTGSHEILEAATNPDPSMPGFALDRGSASGGFTAAGAEPADPCGLITDHQPQINVNGVALHRMWSNRAAAAGHDPCQPAPAEQPYLALAPDQPTIRLRLANVGDTATIGLQAFSDQSVPSWGVSVQDLTESEQHHHYLDLSLNVKAVTPGQRATLTLTARDIAPGQRAIVALRSTFAGHTDVWPVAVMMR